MADLSLSADMTPHVFGIGNSDNHNITGYHSEAIVKGKTDWSGTEKKPIIHARLHQHPKSGCFLARWSYTENDSGGKWSDMFPTKLTKDEVVGAIKDAVAYRNKRGTTGVANASRLEGLCKKHNVSWCGQASINSLTIVIGGKSSGDKVTTAFPLRKANANY